jgi:hypothetical protein
MPTRTQPTTPSQWSASPSGTPARTMPRATSGRPRASIRDRLTYEQSVQPAPRGLGACLLLNPVIAWHIMGRPLLEQAADRCRREGTTWHRFKKHKLLTVNRVG